MGLGRLRDGLAPTPPMGWNSWNRFQTKIDERLIRETAEAMIETGMRDAGYRYVVIDDGWEAPERDGDGDLGSDPERFGSGIADLARRVHGLGMRFGIYTDAGTRTCAGYVGSLGYEFRDARRFASWGVDFVKIDWCNTSGLGTRSVYWKWSNAFRAAGRPMILSLCEWGRTRPWQWGGRVGHLWRTCWDIQDTWDSLTTVLDRQRGLAPYAGPDHWNDPDMLEVGNGGMTTTEYRAHFSLWCLLAAPLMAGNDIRTMPDDIRAILTAPEVIAVDQDPLGLQGDLVRAEGGTEVWARELADGSRAVVLFDRDAQPREVAVRWTELGWSATDRVQVRDLWERADRGSCAEGFAARVPAHGVAMLRLSRSEA
ncbi:MAG: glycoside hydrolase family 27 protein [Chloroflexi bacterium]|nr:glycoside hydrolase family 27 protein [Chloroflexota bacterium]